MRSSLLPRLGLRAAPLRRTLRPLTPGSGPALRTPPRHAGPHPPLRRLTTTAATRSPCACSGAPAAPRRKRAFVALGSNVGDRVDMIEQACREMDARGVRVLRTSGLWETTPMYVLEQDKFVNGVCEVSFLLRHHLVPHLHSVVVRGERWLY